MSAKIFYFTGTGNSLMVAKAIGDDLGDSEVTSIARSEDEEHDRSYDTLGIVFPVYWGGLPLKVLEFLPTLKNIKGSYIFAVETHAGGPGNALSQLRAEIQQIGLDLSAGFLLRMPSNYIISYDAPSKQGVQRILGNATDSVKEIVDIVRNKTINLPSSVLSSYSGIRGSYKQFLERVNRSDEKFWVDESCTECKVCVRVCPVQNIVIKDGRPEWMHQCEQCLACINWCPERAIQFGTGTESRGRYTNPRVTVDEMEQ
jgi:formate hydrogenlyase subunit 6/NADH:ubiquinone oxidoreductase subunit I/flavodoxin